MYAISIQNLVEIRKVNLNSLLISPGMTPYRLANYHILDKDGWLVRRADFRMKCMKEFMFETSKGLRFETWPLGQ